MYYAILVGGPHHGINMKLSSLARVITMVGQDWNSQPEYNVKVYEAVNYELKGLYQNPDENTDINVGQINIYHYTGKH